MNRPLPAAAIKRLVDAIAARQGHGKGAFFLDAYGGAINRVPKAATAFVHRDALFSIQYTAQWGAEEPQRRAPGSRRLPLAAPVRLRLRVPELRRPVARDLAARLLRLEPAAAQGRQAEVRPAERVPVPAVDSTQIERPQGRPGLIRAWEGMLSAASSRT